MTLDTRDLAPRIGTQIKASREALLDGTYAVELRELLEQRGVLVFRGLDLDDDEQLAFSQTLGDVIPQGERGIYNITLDKAKAQYGGDFLRGTFCWHIDGTTDDIPTRASLLTPRQLSEVGGRTEFANTYASYEDLPEADQRAIDKLRVVHMQETIQRHVHPNPTEDQLALWRSRAPKTHPMVWTHRSGRKSLVLGLTAAGVEGMDPQAGRTLIDRLQAFATQPQYIYRHEWRMGDLLIWDNTGVMHRVEPYPPESGRLLHRTTLVGEEALV
jgi:alpha-ketoglutarate-dependent taurine dioxygenase